MTDELASRYRKFQGEQNEEGKKRWVFGNQVLYDMCKNNLGHEDADVIAGKIWLIGRSYAAAVERREKTNGDSDGYYYEKVVPAFIRDHEIIDDYIAQLRQCSEFTSKSIDLKRDRELAKLSVVAHGALVEVLIKSSTLENPLVKRSFASKYLHFHCPEAVYIYDDRANTALRKWVRSYDEGILKGSELAVGSIDKEYERFVCRVLELRKRLLKNGVEECMSPRDIDDFLLWLYRQEER